MVTVRGARIWTFPIELEGDDPVMVHRRPSCFSGRPAALSVMVYPMPVPWWEALSDQAIDLEVPVCPSCGGRAVDVVRAYDLERMDDYAA